MDTFKMSTTKTIKETKYISFSVTCHVYFVRDFHRIIKWAMNTCSALLVWHLYLIFELFVQSVFTNKTCLLISKNFTNAMPHTLFVTCRNPISLFIHAFTNRKKKVCFWLSEVFCVNNLGKDLSFSDTNQSCQVDYMWRAKVYLIYYESFSYTFCTSYPLSNKFLH